MKLVILLILAAMLTTNSYAFIDEPIAMALDWWLIQQDKKVDSVVRTHGSDDGYWLGEWKVAGVTKPNEAQIEQIVEDYKLYLIDEEDKKSQNKTKIKNKLGLSEQEYQELKELME